jgi:hypothetical protein
MVPRRVWAGSPSDGGGQLLAEIAARCHECPDMIATSSEIDDARSVRGPSIISFAFEMRAMVAGEPPQLTSNSKLTGTFRSNVSPTGDASRAALRSAICSGLAPTFVLRRTVYEARW